MAVGGDNYNNISDFPDLFLDNLLLEETTAESQLCIPQDSLDGLELYPNFSDDSICLSELLLTPEHKTLFHGVLDDVPPHAAKLEPEHSRLSFGGFPEQQEEEEEAKDDNKMQETEKKRGLKRARSRKNRLRRSWSCKDPKFVSSSENQVVSGVGEKRRRRRCSHCETEETPQWRVGPEGPNSLCNACGVRYKSGRLVPEYRPAASPSFDISKHSNFHRKIIKRKGEERRGEERREEQSHV